MNRKSQAANKNNDRDLVDLGEWLTGMGVNWDGDISQIKVLNLAYHELTNLPESIGQLVNLQDLCLSRNQITSLPKSIGQLTNLQKLNLSGNQLTSLPESIGQLINLQKLYLNGNQITSLPESIDRLINLQGLHLSINQLTSLSESIGQLVNLQDLCLGGNQLTNLPESIGRLINLQILSLGGNQITSIPESIGRLINLQILFLGGNQITSIPESIGRLTNLKDFYFTRNQLTSIPESIGRLTNLCYLSLDDNQLTSLPESIGQLTNLQKLNLNNNPLNDLSPLQRLIQKGLHVSFLNILDLPRRYWAKFSDWNPECLLDEKNEKIRCLLIQYVGCEKIFDRFKLANLQELDLSFNQEWRGTWYDEKALTSIPESIGELTNLRVLNLAFNQLTSIPESIGRLTNLRVLDLSFNQLTSIPESIGLLTNLRELNLHINQLTGIPESIGQLTNLQKLNLNNNPLNDLSPLQRLTQKCLHVSFLNILDLPRRYWAKFSDWNPEWLLDEDNIEIRRILVQQVGYEKVCDLLGAYAIDTWREYTLLKIDRAQRIYLYIDEYGDEIFGWESMVLLKMTCPSTKHIHILRVPPEMTSAEAAITWVNHGIHPDKIAVQT